jgi:hypothetical protein
MGEVDNKRNINNWRNIIVRDGKNLNLALAGCHKRLLQAHAF